MQEAGLLSETLQQRDVWIEIEGSSMSPFLRDGQKVLVNKEKTFLRGDILVFSRGENIVCHRFIRRKKDAAGNVLFQTKPESLDVLDAPVAAGQILGRIVAVKHGQRDIRIDSMNKRLLNMWLWFCAVLRLALRRYAAISGKCNHSRPCV